MSQGEWEYKEYARSWSDFIEGEQPWAMLGTQVTRPITRYEWWVNLKPHLVEDLREWFEEGWEPLSQIGPDCIEIDEKQKTDFLTRGPAIFNRNTYVFFKGVRIQMRRHAGARQSPNPTSQPPSTKGEVTVATLEVVARTYLMGQEEEASALSLVMLTSGKLGPASAAVSACLDEVLTFLTNAREKEFPDPLEANKKLFTGGDSEFTKTFQIVTAIVEDFLGKIDQLVVLIGDEASKQLCLHLRDDSRNKAILAALSIRPGSHHNPKLIRELLYSLETIQGSQSREIVPNEIVITGKYILPNLIVLALAQAGDQKATAALTAAANDSSETIEQVIRYQRFIAVCELLGLVGPDALWASLAPRLPSKSLDAVVRAYLAPTPEGDVRAQAQAELDQSAAQVVLASGKLGSPSDAVSLCLDVILDNLEILRQKLIPEAHEFRRQVAAQDPAVGDKVRLLNSLLQDSLKAMDELSSLIRHQATSQLCLHLRDQDPNKAILAALCLARSSHLPAAVAQDLEQSLEAIGGDSTRTLESESGGTTGKYTLPNLIVLALALAGDGEAKAAVSAHSQETGQAPEAIGDKARLDAFLQLIGVLGGAALPSSAQAKVIWSAGQPHPQYPNVVAGKEEGNWSPAPGYWWTNPDSPGDLSVHWTPGKSFPQASYLIASETEGSWILDSGYEAVEEAPGKMKVRWAAGLEHPRLPHVISGEEEGTWGPAPGYGWVSPQDEVDALRGVEWTPGLPHPDQSNLESGDQEGMWVPAAGYVWANPGSTDDRTLQWSPGTPHPRHPNVVASDTQGSWISAPGYSWSESGEGNDWSVKWVPGTPHERFPHTIASYEEGVWQPELGYWLPANDEGDLTAQWLPLQAHPEHPHIVAGQSEGSWVPASGYRLLGSGDSLAVIWIPGRVHSRFKELTSLEAEGHWEYLPPDGSSPTLPGFERDFLQSHRQFIEDPEIAIPTAFRATLDKATEAAEITPHARQLIVRELVRLRLGSYMLTDYLAGLSQLVSEHPFLAHTLTTTLSSCTGQGAVIDSAH